MMAVVSVSLFSLPLAGLTRSIEIVVSVVQNYLKSQVSNNFYVDFLRKGSYPSFIHSYYFH